MTPAWDPVDMEKVAFHEAGHAIVGWLFGLPLAYIYLDLEKEGGETAHRKSRSLCLVQQIATFGAGTVAEEIFKVPPCLVALSMTA
jgi:hypothetical protein